MQGQRSPNRWSDIVSGRPTVDPSLPATSPPRVLRSHRQRWFAAGLRVPADSLPATLAAASLSAGGVPRLPAPSTHAGPGLQPSDLHIMAQQAAQQAAARVLAHFVPPSASASTAALRHRVLAALQPGLFRWHLPNSPAAAGIHGSPAVFWPQCHHCNLTVMGLPASLSLPPSIYLDWQQLPLWLWPLPPRPQQQCPCPPTLPSLR